MVGFLLWALLTLNGLLHTFAASFLARMQATIGKDTYRLHVNDQATDYQVIFVFSAKSPE